MKFYFCLLNTVSAAMLSITIAISASTGSLLVMPSVAEAANVNRIVIRGNSRIDVETVKNNITINPGRQFNNDDIDESVKRLFSTGLFADVSIKVSGGNLVVTVEENQIVNQVIFNGNEKIKDQRLEVIVQTKPLSSYNGLLLDADIKTIKDAYSSIGRDDASVTTEVVELGDGRVNIAFKINEGDRTKISSINFIGNNAFGDSRLADIISTKRSNFLSFIIRKDIYDEDKLRADEEVLRSFYYDRGYADFRVISSTAELNDAKNKYDITFTVDEGAFYEFGDIKIDSTIPGIDEKSLVKVIKSQPGKAYSATDVEDTITAIADEVANQGYPFAQITPRGDRDFTSSTISVDYLVDEGQRAYVERIEIIGNTRTRGYVIRREFDISEGDPFNKILLAKTTKRLKSLGYFSNVDITTRPGSQADRIIIVVNVTDNATGQFGIGGGYSNTSGASADISISESNFLGRGQFIKLSAGRGSKTQKFGLSFTEPYFLGYRLAAGFDLFREDDSSNSGYTAQKTGGTLRARVPLLDGLTLDTAYGYAKLNYPANSTIKSNPEQAIVSQGSREKSSLSYSLTYKKFDDDRDTREGFALRFNQEIAGLGGDSKYIKTTTKMSYFDVISEASDLVGSFSAGAGYITPFSGSDLSVFDHFYLGGETLRGFDTKGFGPRVFDGSTNIAAAGGTTYFNASADLTAPIPILPKDLGLRFNVFADAATLYGNDISSSDLGTQKIIGADMNWRASVGFGIVWDSPFGPLKIYYAEPVLKKEFDKTKKLGFGASTSF